jgi:beta-lactamase superfamily II metal-dependent hydrolase
VCETIIRPDCGVEGSVRQLVAGEEKTGMAWQDSLATQIWIFSVGRGNAAFIRTGLNQGFILDMNSLDFDPAEFIRKKFLGKLDAYNKRKIAQAILSHPHTDHIAECAQLKDEALYPALLTCPHDKDYKDGTPSNEKLNWNRIKNQDKDKEVVETYKSLYKGRELPLQTIRFDSNRAIPNLEYGVFYIRPPICETLHERDDNAYGNSTSIMFYLRHESNSILFPGDMTPEGMKRILDDGKGVEKRYTVFNRGWAEANPETHRKTGGQTSLKDLLRNRGLAVLVAPHHGLESCYSSDLYDAIKGGKPRLVVISERRRAHENDGKTHANYQGEKGAIGLKIRREGMEEMCNSVTTKNGYHILIVFESAGAPKVFAEKDPEKLLAKL